MNFSITPRSLPRALKRCRMVFTEGTMLASTASITTLAWPSSRLIRAVRRDRAAFSSGFCSRSRMAPRPGAAPRAPTRSLQRLAPRPRPFHQGIDVAQQLAAEVFDLVQHVVPQPGRGGELHTVGLLVQADPEPEVRGFDVEFALHGDDVRRHQQQPPGGGGRGVLGERGEGIVLAQDLAGEEGQDGAQLAAGDGAADAGRAGADRCRGGSRASFPWRAASMTAKLCVFALAQEARSTTRTVGITQVPGGLQAGDVVDVRHRDVRHEPQVLHRGADLGGSQGGPGGRQPGGRGSGELPVDQGLGRLG